MLTRLMNRAAELISNPHFAYTCIFLLQLKALWGYWGCKDVESGDTFSYFITARMWHFKGLTILSWSPLYTSFMGSLFNISTDAQTILVMHRMVIVLTLAVLVLALMRRLVAPEIAYLVAAWWALLPINFNSLYEVHLFALIPLLCAFVVIATWPGTVGRGIGIGILLLSVLLVRNEVLIILSVFGGLSLLADLRGKDRAPMGRVALSYGLPVLAAIAVTLYFYDHAQDRGPALGEMMKRKQTLNVCQTYAASYAQRHPEWNHSPWTECQTLMQSTFGKPEPTMLEALLANPGAMMGHYMWNASLIPNGLQVMLLNGTSGKENPDFAAVSLNVRWALLGTIGLLLIVAGGFLRIRKRWKAWYEERIEPRRWIWIALLSTIPVAAFVMLTQRPRPSYLFAFALLLMAIVGLALEALIAGKAARIVVAMVAIGAVFASPTYSARIGCYPRTLLAFYRFLQPESAELGAKARIMTSGYGQELCVYLGKAGEDSCTPISYYDARPRLVKGDSLAQVLADEKAGYVLVDQAMMTEPKTQEFVASAPGNGWELVSQGSSEGFRLRLYRRVAR